MSRFSPQPRPATHDQYRRMETGITDAILGAENWKDTRKRQDSAEARADRGLDLDERGVAIDESDLTRRKAYDWKDEGIGYGEAPVDASTEGGQRTDGGMGQTLPNVGGMPTVEGQGTELEVRGSAAPGDMNSQMDGYPFVGNGEFFVIPKSPQQVRDEAREQELISDMKGTNDPRINQARTPSERRRHAAAVVRGYGIEEDPRAAYELEEEFDIRREGRGGGARDPARYKQQIKAAETAAFNRAVELVEKSGAGYTDAAYRARLEMEEEFGVTVAISASDLEDYYQSGSGEARSQEAHEAEMDEAGRGGMRDRVISREGEGSPAYESPASRRGGGSVASGKKREEPTRKWGRP